MINKIERKFMITPDEYIDYVLPDCETLQELKDKVAKAFKDSGYVDSDLELIWNEFCLDKQGE
jgi:penicillin V acylase-like amidase (Ntn superfamily)